MSARGPLEADTCRDYVVPRLKAAGWSEDQIVEQYPVADGRILATRGRHRREKPLRADYLLEIAPGLGVGVVEAKREYKRPEDGFGQAVRYATMLDLPLAYSTNGKGSGSATSTPVANPVRASRSRGRSPAGKSAIFTTATVPPEP